jgi:hypothetical protein
MTPPVKNIPFTGEGGWIYLAKRMPLKIFIKNS